MFFAIQAYGFRAMSCGTRARFHSLANQLGHDASSALGILELLVVQHKHSLNWEHSIMNTQAMSNLRNNVNAVFLNVQHKNHALPSLNVRQRPSESPCSA